MSNLCRESGEPIQFVCNIHEEKGGKDSTESIQELTAGAEKNKQNLFITLSLKHFSGVFFTI